MNQLDIANTILHRLYEARFGPEYEFMTNLHEIRSQEGWDENIFWKVVEQLQNEEFIRPGPVASFKISAIGVIYAEENGIAPQELARKRRYDRGLLLDALAKIWEDPESSGEIDWEQLSEMTGITGEVLKENLKVIEDLGLVDFFGRRCKITNSGLEEAHKCKQKVHIQEEFERISKMEPHPRGLALQKLFAKVVKQYGWSQEESVRTAYEEMDVIIFRGREYYLVECKWEKNKVGARVIRELYGKLSNRADVRGVVVSMSGFTKGVTKQVQDYVANRVILLYSSGDVRSMVFERSTFDELLNAKYKALVTQRNVLFS